LKGNAYFVDFEILLEPDSGPRATVAESIRGTVSSIPSKPLEDTNPT